MNEQRRFDNKWVKKTGIVSLWCLLHRMNLGNTCLGSKLERSCLKQQKKDSERGCFNLKGKVLDSSVFCCASPPKKDGQVFVAAVVASHQDFGFQAALQRLGTTRNLSGQLHFSTRRCRDGDTLDDAAVQGLERMLRVKALLDTVSAGHDGSGETVFETAHATADENNGIVELHEVHESDFSKAEAAVAAATPGENKGIIGLHEVNESVAAATAGKSEGTTRLLD